MSKYSYGWQPSPPDIRDVMYSAPANLASEVLLPPSVDLTRPAVQAPFEPVWNQGPLGSCGPTTASADIVYAALKQDNLPSVPMPSRLFIYYCTRTIMGTVGYDSGVTNRDLMKALARFGWCDESLWPYDISKFTQKPPTECFEQAAERRIEKYMAVPQDLTTMKACLAARDPFIFGFSVYESFESPSTKRTGVVPIPKLGERRIGGHDVMVCGYDSETRRFKFRNSYDVTWGQNGYGWIPFDYATDPRLAGDFWTVRHAHLKPPQPAPAENKTVDFLSSDFSEAGLRRVRALFGDVSKVTVSLS